MTFKPLFYKGQPYIKNNQDFKLGEAITHALRSARGSSRTVQLGGPAGWAPWSRKTAGYVLQKGGATS